MGVVYKRRLPKKNNLSSGICHNLLCRQTRPYPAYRNTCNLQNRRDLQITLTKAMADQTKL